VLGKSIGQRLLEELPPSIELVGTGSGIERGVGSSGIGRFNQLVHTFADQHGRQSGDGEDATSEWEHPHQERPPTRRRDQNDGRPVPGDQIGLYLLIGLSFADELTHRVSDQHCGLRAGVGH